MRHQSLEQSQWTVRDHLVSGFGLDPGVDRAQSEAAAQRYAVREAVAEQRRLSPRPRRPRRHLAWRRTRRAVTKTA